ncbi:MAG TPA: alpha-galactosidase [Eggerthellaceae bacterium]|nr:alpha-galactosidase [Eggerthellaceae bacterium]
MEPAGFAIGYISMESGDIRHVSGDVPAQLVNDDVSVQLAFDGQVIQVAVEPLRPVLLESAQVQLRHAFATNESVLLNGYQSWTDTAERSAWSSMRGLRGVPKRLVERYSFDAIGDYGIVAYEGRRGLQHGFTYATFRRGQGMVLVGSMDESQGFTVIRTDAGRGQVLVEPECPLRVLDAGERAILGRIAVVRGTVDECYDRWFQLSGVKARPIRPLLGYTSWYRHYGDIDARKLEHDLRGFSQAMADMNLLPKQGELDEGEPGSKCQDGALPGASAAVSGSARSKPPAPQLLFQIDDGYCKVGDWLDVDEEKFPDGLASLAAAARERGILPGLWIAPFVCERESRVFSERPEWLLRDASGNPVPTGSHWSGGFALDTRNTEVRSYVLDVLRTIVREWGFGLLKADFLYAACLMPHDRQNRGQLMADAIDLLRTGAGEDVLLLGCGVPLGSAFGRVDYCRIGCDVGLDWDDAPHMRLLHRERVSTKNSLGNTRARQPLDGRAFGNDPDVFFLRDDVKLTDAQRDDLLFADAASGSVLLTSDDMAAWDERKRSRYQAAVRVFLQ